jgi:hypothetical protein
MIYHYCSMESFYNIFRGHKLWLSDATKMNDSKEMNILLDGFKEVVLKEFDDRPFELATTFDKNKTSWNEYETRNIIEIFYKKCLDEYYYLNGSEYTAFLICFCKQSDILSQWYMYADQAKGVAIGFDRRDVEEFVSKNSHYEFVKVNYINEDDKGELQKNLAVEILKTLKEKLPRNIQSIKTIDRKFNVEWDDETVLEQLFRNLKESCFIKLLKESLKCKSKDFEHEHEYRLIYEPQETYFDKFPETDDEKEEYDAIDYRLSYGILVKYMAIKLEDICLPSKTTIFGDCSIKTGETIERSLPGNFVLGPKNRNYIDEIMHFMTKEGFAYYPRKSVISYK